MRASLLAGVLAALLAGPALADSPRASQQACDSTKIGGRELADCLRVAAERSDRDLAATVAAALKSIDGKPGLLSSQKGRWRRSLSESEAQWVNWREVECQDVAPFEAGMAAKGADPRLACVIDANAERMANLKARYP